jgi:hypothetical protein
MRVREDKRQGVIAVGSIETDSRQARFEYTWRGPEEARPVLINNDEMLLSCNVEFWNDKEMVVGMGGGVNDTVDQHTDAEEWVSDHFESLDPHTVLTEQYTDCVPEQRRTEDSSLRHE